MLNVCLMCRWLVQQARQLGLEVIDRCNLTVLLEPGQEDLVEFLAANKVRCAPVQAQPRQCSKPVAQRLQNGSLEFGCFHYSTQRMEAPLLGGCPGYI